MTGRRCRRTLAVPALAAVATLLCACGSTGTTAAPRAAAARPPAAPSAALPAEPIGPRLTMRRFHRQPSAGILVEIDSHRVLWALHPTRVLPIASLTKMMTAFLVVRRAHAGDRVAVTREALAYRGSGVGLLPKGRRVPLEPLLFGLLLPSGNDAAIALAQHVAGTVPAFVAKMNAAARAMHLDCTHYTSPASPPSTWPSRGSPGSSASGAPCSRSRSRAASSISTTTTRCCAPASRASRA